ncbi:hypothetical protein HPB47_019422 [Ixodes persulcatus]|uniref:Uncharacterized protein n=1 Tax=Ixodes persulcatus TaxID=34615 RepID=A0AC60QK39_IXOPE|nr:hypothetical protein HPB47_019422 [Ixodes persulcatus]
MNGKTAGNVLVSAGIVFTGASPTSVLRTLEHISIHMFTPRTSCSYQRGYLLPAISETGEARFAVESPARQLCAM